MPLRKILSILLLGASCSVAPGQASYVDIIGPSTRFINEAGGFEARFYNSSGVWVSAPPGEISYDWYVGGGPTYQVNSESKLNANIQWLQGGTATLEYALETWDNFFMDYMDVVVSAPAPPPPNSNFSIFQNCGYTVVVRNTNPASDIDWYWQSSSTGTDLLLGNASSITILTDGPLFLRARLKDAPNPWSASAQSVGSMTVKPKVLVAPTAQNGSRCGPGSVTLAGTPGANANSLRWYSVSSGESALATGTNYSPTLSVTTTYYISSFNTITGCESSARTAVVGTINSESSPGTITSSNYQVCVGGTLQFTVSGNIGTPYYWISSNNGEGWDMEDAATLGNPFDYPFNTAGLWLIKTHAQVQGCPMSVSFSTIQIDVRVTPSLPATTTPASRCGTGALVLSATPGANGAQVRWYTASSGGTLLFTGNSFTTPSLSSSTTYYACTYNSAAGCEGPRSPVVATINATPGLPTPVHANRCGTGSVTLTATIGTNGNVVRWYTASSGGSAFATGTSYNTPSLSATTTYYLSTYNSTSTCESGRTPVTATIYQVSFSAPTAPSISSNTCGDKTLTKGTAPGGVGWYWQGLNANGMDYTSGIATASTYVVSVSNSYYLRVRDNATGCWGPSTARVVTIDKPLPPANASFSYCEFDNMTLTTTGYLSNLKWYNTGGTLLYTGITYTPLNLAPGNYTYNVKNLSVGGCESLTSATLTLTVPSNCDQYLNWTENTSFTVNSGGATVATAANKIYYDGLSARLQSQAKTYTTNQVLANQPINDTNGQPALSTLPAPINSSSFVYRHKFVTNGSGVRYNAYDFDKRPESTNPGGVNFPAAVANGGIGTLGWYYSTSNTMEPLTPTSSYPYSRTYTPDGPDPTTSKSAVPGDQHKMGSGHDLISDRAKITTELSHYYAIRAHFVLPPNSTAIPTNPGYKFTITDPNGKKVVSFVDADGRSLASATLTGASTYENWSYTFYNDLNQVVATVAPNGVNTASTTLPNFATTFKYDHLGRVIETKSPDEGKSQFVYSLDGKIRFSQNQAQYVAQRFSYTNYDYLGRVIESGEYSQSGTGFYVFEPQVGTTPVANSVLTLVENIGYTGITRTIDPNNRCLDYTYVAYDKQADDLPADALHAAQANMFTKVSRTENVNSKTWYSYDEFGQLLWTKQYVNDLSIHKTVDYSYNFAGNLTEVAYQKGIVAEDFNHYYVYDTDQRLIEVQTSVDAGATKVSRAKYFYYLHGPLKRVTLMNGATKVQGIDYVYTINGALKGINHVDNARDPGNDVDDVFGETISYYDNDYTGAGYTAGTQTFTAYGNQFGGAIKGLAWRSPADNQMNKNAYAFTYDPLYQLTNGDFGNMSGTSSYTFGVQSNVHKETIGTYDKNGNINSLQRRGKGATLTGDYSYVYLANTNKIDKINNSGALMVDYNYNGVGQMVQQVEGSKTLNVTYNANGLVKDVKNGSNQLMQEYFYDDQGNRFINKIYNNGALVKTVYYIHDAGGNVQSIYEKINTTTTQIEVPVYASGRVATFKPPVNTYFYEVNDHLGNVRAVIGLPDTDTYRATMESENSTLEEAPAGFFKGIAARRVPFVGANVTANYTNSLGIAVTGNEVVRVNNVAPAGPGISLKVSPGDKINAEVWAYYEAGISYSNMIGVPTMITAIAAAFGGVSGAPGESGQIFNDINSGVTGNIGGGSEPTLPAAYLQYIVYDANRNPTGQKGFFRVTSGGNVAKEKITMPQITIEQPGFIYIFVYNRSNAANWVYFDEMLVTHVHSTIVAGADYYPFGLVMDGREITDEAYRYGYQGQYAEEDETTGWNEFQLRMYDARFGRWMAPDPAAQYWSPYIGMGNDPSNLVDPTGGCTDSNGNNIPCPEGIPEAGNRDLIILPEVVIMPDLLQNSGTLVQTSGYLGPPRDFESIQYQAAYEAANTILYTGVALDFVFDSNLSGANPPPEGQARMQMPIFMGGPGKIVSVLDKAADISKALKVNSLTIKAAGNLTNEARAIKHIRYDLKGLAHGNIPIPHKTIYRIHKNPITGIGSTKGETTPITDADIRLIANYLKSLK